jgi:hypothetical protein
MILATPALFIAAPAVNSAGEFTKADLIMY